MAKVGGLPDEIIEDILLRLPAAPLIRFKSVSDAWYKLINDSRFINKHLARGAKLKIMFRSEIQVPNESGKPSSVSRFVAVDYDAFGEDVEMLDQAYNDISEVYNSCRGLVLVGRIPLYGSVYIWNPTTGKRHLLPNPLIKSKSECGLAYGLGYDSNTDTYKVLCAHYDEDDNANDPYGQNWSLYKQCTNSWQRLNNIPYDIAYPSMKFLENALHMLASTLTSSADEVDTQVILAFDLISEEFREVPLPNHVSKYSLTTIEASHGCLCLVSPLDGETLINAWVMKEYGNRQSWTKTFSINREIFSEHPIPAPIHLSETGEILVSTGDESSVECTYTRLVHYNSIMKNWKTFNPLISGLKLLGTTIYVESLVKFDIAENPHEENKERKTRNPDSLDENNRETKRRNTRRHCFEVVVNSSTSCDINV